MVKFCKQLEDQLVPEWKDVYCNYKELKKDVKRIKQEQLSLQDGGFIPASVIMSGGLQRSIDAPVQNINDHLQSHIKSSSYNKNRPSGAILVFHKKDDRQDNDEYGEVHETEVMEPLGKVEVHRAFFNRLDAQFNKINRFYKLKEMEFIVQARRLEKQLLALRARQSSLILRSTKSKRTDDSSNDDESTENRHCRHAEKMSKCTASSLNEIIIVSKAGNRPYPAVYDDSGRIKTEEGCHSASDEEMDIDASFIENAEVAKAEEESDDSTLPYFSNMAVDCEIGENSSCGNRKLLPTRSPRGALIREESAVSSPAHMPIIMHIPGNSPLNHTVTAQGDYHPGLQRVRESVSTNKIEDQLSCACRPRDILQDMIDLSMSKRKISSCEKMLRAAFIEFYRGLGLLKSYSSLNMMAFAKILKKYDKVVKWNLAPIYIKEVECSYFASSDKVTKLMTEVEDTFTKHFSDHDRREAMARLRPMQQRGSHTTTFFLGIFSGLTVTLLIGFILILLAQNEYRTNGGKGYMESVFKIFSTLGLLLLHMYMYGWNVYAWQRTRINYGFIFEFSPGTELRYREIFLICTGLSSMLLGTMVVHIIASAKDAPNYDSSEWAPLSITLVFLVMLLIPLNVLYKSSRYAFLRCFRRIIFAPFYKVVLSDFFLGDQLTSQAASFRNFEFMLCYYSGGYFQHRDDSACSDNTTFKLLMFVFSLLPYWWRFMQCLRRCRDEGDKLSLYNAGKYMSAMVAVALTLAYASYRTVTLLVLFMLSSCCASLYQLYWDVVVDWGLLRRNSKNPWLRDNLILKRKYLYYISMWVNVLLRLVWILSFQPQTVIPGFSQPAWDVMLAALEVIRRGLWNFHRLENEHLNNVGEYRAGKTVPLPFKELEGGII